jgi:hypothetical protein
MLAEGEVGCFFVISRFSALSRVSRASPFAAGLWSRIERSSLILPDWSKTLLLLFLVAVARQRDDRFGGDLPCAVWQASETDSPCRSGASTMATSTRETPSSQAAQTWPASWEAVACRASIIPEWQATAPTVQSTFNCQKLTVACTTRQRSDLVAALAVPTPPGTTTALPREVH